MSFIEHFAELDDSRSSTNRQHELLDIVFLVVSAVLSGAEGWKDIKEFGDAKLSWLRKFRAFEAGIPLDDTLARVVSALKPAQFLTCFVSWLNEMREANDEEHIAIDGKTLRRSFEKGKRTSALHMMSVFASQSELYFTGKRSSGKKNEQAAILELLASLEIQGQVITLDAMGTKRIIAETIKANGGDYILALKGNQKNLAQEVKDYFHQCRREDHIEKRHTHTELDTGHGRIEQRTLVQLLINDWIDNEYSFPGMKSVIELERVRHIGEQTTTETQYYISSLPVNPKQSAQHIRSHWGVENKVHWVLDMSFREDESRIRRGEAAEIMALFRRFCMNLARLNTSKNSIRGKLKQAGWNDRFREQLLFA